MKNKGLVLLSSYRKHPLQYIDTPDQIITRFNYISIDFVCGFFSFMAGSQRIKRRSILKKIYMASFQLSAGLDISYVFVSGFRFTRQPKYNVPLCIKDGSSRNCKLIWSWLVLSTLFFIKLEREPELKASNNKVSNNKIRAPYTWLAWVPSCDWIFLLYSIPTHFQNKLFLPNFVIEMIYCWLASVCLNFFLAFCYRYWLVTELRVVQFTVYFSLFFYFRV